MAKIHLIDASPYIFRAYYSIPATMKTPDGMVINAVYGYADFLIQLLKKQQPSHIAVAFDGSLTTSFRNEIYPEYKAQRESPPPDLQAQFEFCFELTKAMGMAAFIDDRYEADDIIGAFVEQLLKQKHELIVVSNDKDLAQLVNENVRFWDFAKDKLYNSSLVKEHFGAYPHQIVDLLALMGDSVDNIPGVKGVGRKTAVALLEKFAGIQEIYANLDEVENLPIRGAKSVKMKLSAEKNMAELSYQLATIAMNAPVKADLESLQFKGANHHLIETLFERLGFGGIQERIPKWQENIE